MSKKPIVGIIMGSDSDLSVMSQTALMLEKLDIPYEMTISSAHRTLDKTVEYTKIAEKKGLEVIIVGAGMAAHLAGVVASITTLPIIGIPMATKDLSGMDSLYSMVQMPKGVPVATLTIGKHGAINAAILAAQILALKYKDINKKVKDFKKQIAKEVHDKDSKLKKIGFKKYLKNEKK